jgi:hypothetical protein
VVEIQHLATCIIRRVDWRGMMENEPMALPYLFANLGTKGDDLVTM